MSAAAPAPASPAPERAGADSAFEASTFERSLGGGHRTRWIGWRRRALVLAALAGCLSMFWLARWLAATPQIDARWTAGANGSLVLQASPLPALQAHAGRTLQAIAAAGSAPLPVDALLLHHSPRWQIDDAARTRQVAMQEQLATWLATGPVRLHFDDDAIVELRGEPRGYAGLGVLFWPLAALALLLYLFAIVVLLTRLQARNLLFLVATLGQSANLLFIAFETAHGLGMPPGLQGLDMGGRVVLDACTGAAIVHGFALHPRRLARASAIGATVWLGALTAVMLLSTSPAHLWWWAQALCLAMASAALWVVGLSLRAEPNPHAVVMRRFAAIALATLLLVTAAVALSARMPTLAHGVAAGAAATWYLFLASLLLLTPFLARSRQVLREFALLAGISTVATSVDLLFVAIFSLSPFTSLAVGVFLALAVYAGARQYILQHTLGSSMLTTERIFENLYRVAREVQATPDRYPQLLGQLLRELFEPLELLRLDRVPAHARVIHEGAALVVPLRTGEDDASAALVLRFAQRGQRLFTRDDARLADRVVEQLRRAVAYDQAVERGRHEERLRIAQDLHDDIGARLLTLMYQAHTPEMEDYIRHTLQDLKTLTRGLAAAEHRLSHAAAEWKADLTQRLTVANVELGWQFSYEKDMRLSVVQWSALTRVLRELVSNALYHGHATRIDVDFRLEGPRLTLRVSDDGRGRDPQAWAHGLGLGGVRKRVKLLGGEVQWRDNSPRGIVCEVQVPEFTAKR
jgi:signal transduction histidine kinase